MRDFHMGNRRIDGAGRVAEQQSADLIWEPPIGVLRDYENHWLPTSDAPRVYQVACAMSVLSTVVSNRIWLPFGGQSVYCNLWVLILGPSSFYRKSTCIAKAKRTIQQLSVREDGEPDRSPLLPDEFSREALLKRLSERGQGLMTFSEFSGFLALLGRDYMSGTKETLSDLYDCQQTYSRSVGANEFVIRNAYLNILAASQTDWFTDKLKAGDVRGGFLARFCYWPAFTKPRFIAVPPEPDQGLGRRLLGGLNEIRRLSGAVILSAEAKTVYTKWVERHERELEKSDRVGDLSPFWSRLSIMTLKFAMLIQVSHDRSLNVSGATMQNAIVLTEHLKGSLQKLFASEFAFTPAMQSRQRLLRLIERGPALRVETCYERATCLPAS
jgi:Protein of unknown function (DUF3987)